MYKTKIFPVVLYGCETLSLILEEEHRLKGCLEQCNKYSGSIKCWENFE
jgi:hypothetical protein